MRTPIAIALLAALALTGCRSNSKCHHCHNHHQMPTLAAQPPAQEPAIPEEAEPVQPVVQLTSGPRHGHADDYRWLVGQLQRVNLSDGHWKIRYAPLDQVDQWGGSVILAPDIRLENYKEGQNVYVEGEILVRRPSLYVAGPLFRIRTIRPASEM